MFFRRTGLRWCADVAALVALLAIGTAGYFYAQSFTRAHCFALECGSREPRTNIFQYAITFYSGVLRVSRDHHFDPNDDVGFLAPPPAPWPHLVHASTAVVDDDLFLPDFDTHWQEHFLHPSIAYRLGFSYNDLHTGTARSGAHSFTLTAPLWAVLMVLAILPVRFFSTLPARIRQARSARRGPYACPGCAYDLRASIARCPECGQPIAVPVPVLST